jgi:cellulose synthase/poly-beta-1,6-N-acetylglucosamine synthase-like glycosyltransferase
MIETPVIEAANLALSLLAVGMAVPVLFLAVQLGAALLPARASAQVSSVPCPRIAVVMPAHNEEAIIARTVDAIVAQLRPDGRLLVVADNCTDSTAQIASQAGAEVTLRRKANRIGKGYALDHGIRILRADPPEIIIFVDADCEVGQGSLETLAKHCASTGRPTQARYFMLAPPSASSADKVSQLAWVIKTLVRPLGSARLGLPCQLMGSGIAMPFEIASQLNLATGHLAEDQKLGAELALAGKLTYFCPQARVLSQIPQGESGKRQQRTRWEHGHLAIIGEFFLPLTRHAISKRSLRILAFALDLCIPPLSLLVLLLALTEATTLLWFVVTGLVSPLVVSTTALGCLAVSIGAAWWRFGQSTISLRELTAVPAYCLLKIPSFVRFFVNRQIDWIRTER